MSVVITAIAAILVFGIVIAVHEFGHFIVAKLSGIQVNEFAIGMGPAIFKKIWHGTQYSIRVLPIGGYNAMEGEESPESRRAAPEDPAEPREKAAGASGLAAEIAAADDADEDSEEPEDLNPVPPEQRTGRPFNEVALWKRFATIAAGALMNFVLGFVVLVFFVSMQDVLTSRVIYSIGEDAACGQTGLQVEDEIIAVNGRECFVADDIVYELLRTDDYSADVTVRRGGSLVEVKGVRFDTFEDVDGTHMKLNFVVYGLEKAPVRVLREAWNYERFFARYIIRSLADLVTGRESVNNLSGPVGIVSAIGTAASYGLEDLLFLMAMITINLGIFNLLPFPALDGGKLVFLVVEGVTGRAVPDRVQGAFNLVGFAALLVLMLFATYNDLFRLFTGQM